MAVWRGDRAAKSQARWNSAAEQAAKQARRAWFPEVTAQAELPQAVRRVEAAALAIVLDPEASESLADGQRARRRRHPPRRGAGRRISPAESDALLDAGAIAARLGPTVLRASSAGIVAAGILLEPHETLGVITPSRGRDGRG